MGSCNKAARGLAGSTLGAPRQASKIRYWDGLPRQNRSTHLSNIPPSVEIKLSRRAGGTYSCEDYFPSAPETSFHEDIVNVQFDCALA